MTVTLLSYLMSTYHKKIILTLSKNVNENSKFEITKFVSKNFLENFFHYHEISFITYANFLNSDLAT